MWWWTLSDGRSRAPAFVAQPAIAEALARVLDLDGPNFGFADPRLQATLQALDLTDHQYLRLASTYTFSCGGGVPAAIGTPSIATIQNPLGSKKVMRIRRLTISGLAAATSHFWGTIANAAVPAILNSTQPVGMIRDTRVLNPALGTAATPAALRVYGTSLGAPTNGEVATVGAGGAVFSVDPLCTIHPGGWFFVASAVVNTAFNCGLVWDERIATTSEINFPISV